MESLARQLAEIRPHGLAIADAEAVVFDSGQDRFAVLFEERAAILEFDEGLCRAEAEALAETQVRSIIAGYRK